MAGSSAIFCSTLPTPSAASSTLSHPCCLQTKTSSGGTHFSAASGRASGSSSHPFSCSRQSITTLMTASATASCSEGSFHTPHPKEGLLVGLGLHLDDLHVFVPLLHHFLVGSHHFYERYANNLAVSKVRGRERGERLITQTFRKRLQNQMVVFLGRNAPQSEGRKPCQSPQKKHAKIVKVRPPCAFSHCSLVNGESRHTIKDVECAMGSGTGTRARHSRCHVCVPPSFSNTPRPPRSPTSWCYREKRNRFHRWQAEEGAHHQRLGTATETMQVRCATDRHDAGSQ